MGTLIESLASKKKAVPAPAPAVLLPLLEKAHEGACGDGCGCADESGGCCSP